MTVTVLFFAHYQDIAGGREQARPLPDGATVADLAALLAREDPRLEGLLSYARVAVNADYADAATMLRDGDEVALMPPMSGGTPLIELTQAPIDLLAVSRRVEASGCGAVVTFAGTVRDNALGNRVLYLEYEAHPPLAQKELARIAAEAEGRWGVAVAVTHRLGRLEIGECSVAVAVAAPHREEAFEACRWVMDTLKARVPIWKKEYFEGGAHWIEGPAAVPSSPAPPESGAGRAKEKTPAP
ncbi:MAG: molybdopterin converting factor subunit 1 [Armatimonadetes bacterium]|nr:molybdopterin converting factor subunit 1 [Armatimonadota bacterium]